MECGLRFLIREVAGKRNIIYILASAWIDLTHSTSSDIESLPNFPLIHIDLTISVKCILGALDNTTHNIKQFVLVNSIKTTFDIDSCKI